MDLIDAMRCFVRVVESGNFTRAADSLQSSTATVTKKIQFLEHRHKVKLLHRTTRRLTVTKEGSAYYERAQRILSDLDDMDASMSDAQASPRGRLRVDVGASVARQLLIPSLPDFFARYPDIQPDLGVSDRTADLIAESVDCVIRAGEPIEQSLVARRIGKIDVVTVAAPAYLERHGTPVHPLDLERGHRTINLFSARNGRQFTHDFVKDGQRLAVAGMYQLAVNESNALAAAVYAGLGITQLGEFHVREDLRRGALVRVLPDWSHPAVPLYVVYPPNRHLNVRVRVFVDWVAALFARLENGRLMRGQDWPRQEQE